MTTIAANRTMLLFVVVLVQQAWSTEEVSLLTWLVSAVWSSSSFRLESETRLGVSSKVCVGGCLRTELGSADKREL